MKNNNLKLKLKNKKLINSGVVVKPTKIRNTIYLGKEKFDVTEGIYKIIKLLLERKKIRKIRKNIKNTKNKHEQHRNETQGNILKINDEIRYNRFLPMYHLVNNYKQLKYELNQKIENHNKKLMDHGAHSSKLLEYKKSAPVNWTDFDHSAIDLIRSIARDRNPDSAKKLAEVVPEFKGMMQDIAYLGTSSAKDYIRGLEKDIRKLNDTKEHMQEENKIL